jgi:hypothetical protein
MPSRNEKMLALARLVREAPISENSGLLHLQDQAAEYLREAKRRYPSNESVSSAVDLVERDYRRHVLRKQRSGIR